MSDFVSMYTCSCILKPPALNHATGKSVTMEILSSYNISWLLFYERGVSLTGSISFSFSNFETALQRISFKLGHIKSFLYGPPTAFTRSGFSCSNEYCGIHWLDPTPIQSQMRLGPEHFWIWKCYYNCSGFPGVLSWCAAVLAIGTTPVYFNAVPTKDQHCWW